MRMLLMIAFAPFKLLAYCFKESAKHPCFWAVANTSL